MLGLYQKNGRIRSYKLVNKLLDAPEEKSNTKMLNYTKQEVVRTSSSSSSNYLIEALIFLGPCSKCVVLGIENIKVRFE